MAGPEAFTEPGIISRKIAGTDCNVDLIRSWGRSREQAEGMELVIEDMVGATGLELKHDPGVPYVYAGFAGETCAAAPTFRACTPAPGMCERARMRSCILPTCLHASLHLIHPGKGEQYRNLKSLLLSLSYGYCTLRVDIPVLVLVWMPWWMP